MIFMFSVVALQGWIDNFNGPSGVFIAVSKIVTLKSSKTHKNIIELLSVTVYNMVKTKRQNTRETKSDL